MGAFDTLSRSCDATFEKRPPWPLYPYFQIAKLIQKEELKMYRYKRLLVGISLNDQDGSSIRYAAMISRLAKSETITFLHVANTTEID